MSFCRRPDVWASGAVATEWRGRERVLAAWDLPQSEAGPMAFLLPCVLNAGGTYFNPALVKGCAESGIGMIGHTVGFEEQSRLGEFTAEVSV